VSPVRQPRRQALTLGERRTQIVDIPGALGFGRDRGDRCLCRSSQPEFGNPRTFGRSAVSSRVSRRGASDDERRRVSGRLPWREPACGVQAWHVDGAVAEHGCGVFQRGRWGRADRSPGRRAIAARALDAGTQDGIHRAMQAVRDVGRYGLSQLDVDGKPVTVLSVARRREGFAQTSAGVVRVRRGTRDDRLFGAELVRLRCCGSRTTPASTMTAANGSTGRCTMCSRKPSVASPENSGPTRGPRHAPL
jgi:hypothetical protein